MEQTTPYRYEAKNDGSYNELAAYAINLVGNVTLFPNYRTIVIDGKFANDVGKFIDKQGLDVFINPIEVNDDNLFELINAATTDSDTLRTIIRQLIDGNISERSQSDNIIKEITENCEALKKQRDDARKEAEMYRRWYSDSNRHADRIKSQVQAVAVLLNSIFPKEK